MAFDVSTLTNYTEENVAILLTSSVLGAKTQMLIAAQGTIMTGVKSAETINILDTDAQFQTGGTCGWNAAGTTAISQRVVTVGKIKINEALCVKTLETKYTQKALQIGSHYENIPFEQQYSDKKSARIAAQNEIAIWQGDTASGNANLNKFDGFIKIITAASGSVVHAQFASGTPYISGGPIFTSGGAITPDQAVFIVRGMYKAIPAQLSDKDDVVIFCGWDFYKTFGDGLLFKNWFHYDADQDTSGEMRIPGTTIKLIAVHGLDGTNRLYALRISNMVIGTDMENEDEKYEIFYSRDNDEVRFRAEWKLGVQVAFPDEIVEFHTV